MATDAQLAQECQDAYRIGIAEGIILAENAICVRLDIPLNETEQGLTRRAYELIRDFCATQGYPLGEE